MHSCGTELIMYYKDKQADLKLLNSGVYKSTRTASVSLLHLSKHNRVTIVIIIWHTYSYSSSDTSPPAQVTSCSQHDPAKQKVQY